MDIKKGENCLKNEVALLKKIILSSNNPIAIELLINTYKNQWENTNKIVYEFFNSNDTEEEYSEHYFNAVIEYCLEYENLENLKEKYNKLNNLDDYLSYVTENIYFIYRYNQYEEYFKLLLWLVKQKEQINNLDNVIDIFLDDKRSISSIRNIISGKNIDVEIEPKNIDVMNNKIFMETLMKMGLTHHFSISTLKIIKEIYDSHDITEIINSYLLYLKLDISVHMIMGQKYGISLENDDTLEITIKNTKELIKKIPKKEITTELLDKFDYLIDDAKEIVMKYNNSYKNVQK